MLTRKELVTANYRKIVEQLRNEGLSYEKILKYNDKIYRKACRLADEKTNENGIILTKKMKKTN
jgi:hypothetical protein